MLSPQIASDILPIEVWRNILFQTDLTDIHSAKRACKEFNDIAHERFLLAKFHSLLPNIDENSMKKRLEIASINFRLKKVTTEAQIRLKGTKLHVEYILEGVRFIDLNELVQNTLTMESLDCGAVLFAGLTRTYPDLYSQAPKVILEQNIKDPCLFHETFLKMKVPIKNGDSPDIMMKNYFHHLPLEEKFPRFVSFTQQLLELTNNIGTRERIYQAFINCLGMKFIHFRKWIERAIHDDTREDLKFIFQQLKNIYIALDQESDMLLEQTPIPIRLFLLWGFGEATFSSIGDDQVTLSYFEKIAHSIPQENRDRVFYLTLLLGVALLFPGKVKQTIHKFNPDDTAITKEFIREACLALAATGNFEALLSLAECFYTSLQLMQLERAVDSIAYNQLAKRYPGTAAGILALKNRLFMNHENLEGIDGFSSIVGRTASVFIGCFNIWNCVKSMVTIPYKLISRDFPPSVAKIELLTFPLWHLATAVKYFAAGIFHPGIALKYDPVGFRSPNYGRVQVPLWHYYFNNTRAFDEDKNGVDPLLRQMLKKF